jgi:tetratricopeptide (TPR) repeat protein/tRNA A-37 threonylcarbamoyl transferase component Bud32
LSGRIADEASREIEAHLDRCSVCLRFVSEMVRGAQSVGPAPHVATPALLRGGDLVGRYRIEVMIGRGAMGSVYAAYDEELERSVAIKVVRAERSGSESHRVRLLREARAIARMTHPNIVTVHDVGTFEDSVFIAMELVNGVSLKEWLAERSRGWDEILRVLKDAARGLAAAHTAGIVHRDFKPANVMVGVDGRGVVVDFGLARTSLGPTTAAELSTPSTPYDPTLTVTGALLGTPAYMAPEQRGGQIADARSDQFSFCVVLYEALYGHRPASQDALSSQPRREPEGLEGRNLDVTPSVRRVLARGLEVAPERRYPSMDALIAALEPDRGAGRLWRGAAVALPVLLGLGGALAWRRSVVEEREACDRAAAAATSIWNETTIAQAEAAFSRARLPYAQTTWHGVRRVVDPYVSTWGSIRGQVCTEQLRGGSTDLRKRQEACLTDRLSELKASASVLTTADSKTLENAVPLVAAMRSPASCLDARALVALTEPRDSARVKELKEQLAKASALREVGKVFEARPIIEDVVRASDEIGYRPLQAAAQYELGLELKHFGDPKAHDAAIRAAVLADSAGDDRLRAMALRLLLYVVGVDEERDDLVPLIDQQLRGTLERLGGDDLLEARRRSTIGGILKRQGKLEDACRELEGSIALMRSVLPPDSDPFGTLFINLSTVYRRQHRYEDALRALDEARRLYTVTRGPTAPSLVVIFNNMADALLLQGNLDRALEAVDRALALAENLPADYPSTATSRETRGTVLLSLHRYVEARSDLEQALALLEKRHGREHLRLVTALTALGNVYLELGEVGLATSAFDRAASLGPKVYDKQDRADLDFARARAILAAGGDRSAAIALAVEAERAYTEAKHSSAAENVRRWIEKEKR